MCPLVCGICWNADLDDPNEPNDPNDPNDPDDLMTESFADDWPYGIFSINV